MKLDTNFLYPTEIQDVAKLFFDQVVADTCADMTLWEKETGTVFCYTAQFDGQTCTTSVDVQGADQLQSLRLRKRYAKICAYNLLKQATGRSMPWGSLTGIRPTKLALQLQSEGANWQQTFVQLLGVSQQKTQLVEKILATQGQLRNVAPDSADLYVGVPFCTTRCSYCSFTSGELARMRQYVEPYVEALCNDILQTLAFAKQQGIVLRNVYFGGGTPTSLSAQQLDTVLNCLDFAPVEFTVEAGRPDTIDRQKLAVLKQHGVHRISINPQTFNQSVLDAVGRKHTVQDIYDKYQLACDMGFVVNMDLIAGLPTESYQMFCHSVTCAAQLAPHNITVHTLALKQGSALKGQHYTSSQHDVAQMVDFAHQHLQQCGYLPYYMYRQKYMTENLENVGFCKEGYQCLYNIGIMEEVSNILACGTNAISKKISPSQNRIERAANAKDVITYIQRNQQYLQKKFQLFSE